jgi:hypothetical protein
VLADSGGSQAAQKEDAEMCAMSSVVERQNEFASSQA